MKNVFWGSRMRIFWIFDDLRSRQGHHFHHLLITYVDFMENGGTSILWDPAMFSSDFRGHDPSGKHNKAKSKAFRDKYYFSYNKTCPSRIFQDFRSSFGTISEHISQLFQASFSSTQKCKKSEWRSLARWGYPRHITEEGRTRSPGRSRRHLALQLTFAARKLVESLPFCLW